MISYISQDPTTNKALVEAATFYNISIKFLTVEDPALIYQWVTRQYKILPPAIIAEIQTWGKTQEELDALVFVSLLLLVKKLDQSNAVAYMTQRYKAISSKTASTSEAIFVRWCISNAGSAYTVLSSNFEGRRALFVILLQLSRDINPRTKGAMEVVIHYCR